MARLEDDEDDRDLDEAADGGDDDDVQPRKKKKNGPSAEEKQMAMFCHLGNLIGFYVPLLIWMLKKNESPFVDKNGKEALNFGISMLIWVFATCCIGGIVLAPLSIYFSIMAGLAANRGEYYRYPMTIRFIK